MRFFEKQLVTTALIFVFLFVLSSCSQVPRSSEKSKNGTNKERTNEDAHWNQTTSSESFDGVTNDFAETSEEAEEEPEDLEFAPSQSFELTTSFCAQWNPEFAFRGFQCCTKSNGRRRIPKSCDPKRRHSNFCGELTSAQKLFNEEDIENIDQYFNKTGSIPWMGSPQAICSSHSGFLSHGIPLVRTASNGIMFNNPARCAQYGTTGLVLLLHRLGKAIQREFSSASNTAGIRLVVGDLSAPRGGCLPTRRGSHAGHTNGLDADVAFLQINPSGDLSNRMFSNKMDLSLNWWFLKQILTKTPVCVQHIFVDRGHINKLKKFAGSDPDWDRLGPLLKHVSGHRNHFHIRVGLEMRRGDEINCKRIRAGDLGENSGH